MGAAKNLSREDRLGLGVAIGAHVALAAVFLLQDDTPAQIEMPERMVVSLADEVSLESTAPDPSAQPAASFAPELAETPSPPVPEPIATPLPRKVETAPPPPPPRPRATTRPEPRVTPTPTPRATASPRAKPTPAPRPAASSRATPTPTPTAAPRAAASARPAATPAPAPRPTRAGGSRIGADFLEGASDAQNSERGSPATAAGPAVRASIQSAIVRQLKPHWSAPSGVDAERLVTVLSWELNRDGSLKGRPRVISQSGINESNRPQAGLHAERAIRAVQLAAPFNLPEEYYDSWKSIRGATFDRNL